jgi:putative transposase
MRTAIFRADEDWSGFIAALASATLRNRWECLAYCLMPNHYHVLVATPEPNLSQGMHHLNSTYATRFNTTHGRTGHLFERRYRSELIRWDGHPLEAARYIVLNPVRAGLADCADGWRWSSYLATAGRVESPPWLSLDAIQRLVGSGSEYAAFVAAGEASHGRPSLAELVPQATASQIATALDAYGYTQATVARHLGISQATVSRLARAGRSPL